MSKAAPDLSVVVLSWNTADLLADCLQALRAGAGNLDLEIVVIDNASEDGSPDRVEAEFPEVRLTRNSENVGYALGVNQGLELARGERVCLLGSDTAVAPDALPTLARFLDDHPRAGAVAPRLLHFDGRLQRACMRFPTLATALVWDLPLAESRFGRRELARYQYEDWDHRGTRQIDQPPGTCLMLPRRVLDELGPMDGRMWLFFNDVDWMKRLHGLGHEVWYVDEATVNHHLGSSTSRAGDFVERWHANRIVYYRKHHGRIGERLAKRAVGIVAKRQIDKLRDMLEDPAEFEAHREQIDGLAKRLRAMDARIGL